MARLEASGIATSGSSEPAVPRPQRLRHRRDFVAASRGRRFHTRGFSLQSLSRGSGPSIPGARFGFTVTRKVGTATERNRIRRRLREAVRITADLPARPDHDYVLVARREALSVPFATLVADLKLALDQIHRTDGKNRRRPNIG